MFNIEIYSTDVFLIVHRPTVNDKTDDNTFKAYVSKQSAVVIFLLLHLLLFFLWYGIENYQLNQTTTN